MDITTPISDGVIVTAAGGTAHIVSLQFLVWNAEQFAAAEPELGRCFVFGALADEVLEVLEIDCFWDGEAADAHLRILEERWRSLFLWRLTIGTVFVDDGQMLLGRPGRLRRHIVARIHLGLFVEEILVQLM